MSSRRPPRWTSCFVARVALALALLIELVRTDELVTCNDDTEWMINESGESPCMVAYYLMLPCAGQADFAVLPLNDSVISYNNPLGGQWCSCNTVVYNLMSACAICQEGLAIGLQTWSENCSDAPHDYPNEAIAKSFKTPKWAYVNVSSLDTFDLVEAEEVATKKGWSPIQIALPVIIGVVVTLLALIAFFLYRRHLKKRYTQIGDAYSTQHSQSHMYNQSQSYSQQNLSTSRPGHIRNASSSTVGLQSLTGRGSPSLDATVPTRRRSAAAVAWERARMHAPRKLGGLVADRRKVHTRKRGASWSIDADLGGVPVEYEDPWHKNAGSASGSRSKEALKASNRPSGHGRSESQLGLLSNTSPERLHPIQDSSDLNTERATPAFGLHIFSGLSSIGRGLAVGLGRRPPPVAVVSNPPRRGFNVDDVDSARSPTVHGHSREEREQSFVFVEHERNAEVDSDPSAASAGARMSVRLEAASDTAVNQSRPGSGSHMNRTRSDTSGETGTSHPNMSNNTNSDNGERQNESNSSDVMLISRSPGQDFNSMASPVTTEETSGLGAFQASVESGSWPAALTDTSSVLHSSFARGRQAGPLLPSSAQTFSSPLSESSRYSQGHSAPGTPRPPSNILIPLGEGNSQLLVPPAVRAAGGYTPQSVPPPLASPSNTAILPNARLFGSANSIAAREPESAVSYATAATTNIESEHGSSEAYTIPNPFTFDERRGGSVGAANALRLASPVPRSRSRTDIIE